MAARLASSAGLKMALPYFNFLVAGGALTFQITVLYPWHIELEREMMQFKDESHTKVRVALAARCKLSVAVQQLLVCSCNPNTLRHCHTYCEPCTVELRRSAWPKPSAVIPRRLELDRWQQRCQARKGHSYTLLSCMCNTA